MPAHGQLEVDGLLADGGDLLLYFVGVAREGELDDWVQGVKDFLGEPLDVVPEVTQRGGRINGGGAPGG